MKITGAEILLECLKREGVRYIFGNPGTTEVAILDALVETPEINYILTLHESVAVGMADGFARAGGGPGFVNAHTSTGTANSIGNLFNAYVDGTPLIMTIAIKDTRILGRDCFSEVPDILGMTRQFAKWSWQVLRPDKIAENTFRAFKVANSPPYGLAFLAIPEDFLAQKVEIEIPPSQSFKSPLKMQANPEEIEKAVKLLLEAKRPLMIAGNEIAKTGAIKEAKELAEMLALPVMTEGRQSLGFMNFPTTHPLYRGLFDPQSGHAKAADVLLGVGCKMFVETRYSETPDVGKKVRTIHLHSDPSQIARRYPVEVPIVTEAREGLTDLIESAKNMISEEKALGFRERFRKLEEEKEREEFSKSRQIQAAWDKVPIRLEQLIKEIDEVADRDAIIVDEAVRSSRSLLSLYHFSQPETYFHNAGGYLGWGLPSSLGIKLALPQRQVIALVGDGTFLFSIQALWTAARYDIPVIIIVCNNRGYKAVRDAAIRFKGKAVEKGLFIGSSINEPAPNLSKIAEGFGIFGTCIEEPGEIRPALEKALHSGKPAVLDVLLEQI